MGLDHDLGLDIAIDRDLALVLVFVPFCIIIFFLSLCLYLLYDTHTSVERFIPNTT